MIKINQFYWHLYKDSPEGKKAIEEFEKVSKPSFTIDDSISLLKEYDPEWFLNMDEADTKAIFNSVFNSLSNWELDSTKSARDNAGQMLSFKYGGDYENAIGDMVGLSFFLHKKYPSFFIPYMFLLRYHYIRQILEDYDLDVIEVPGKANYKNRCLYYIDICEALARFKDDNGLSVAELCALIYDMERRKYDAAYSKENTPFPQVWLIGGSKEGREAHANTMCWQANSETKKGDILVFYETGKTETENKSCLTGFWTAQTDGILDPLFLRYGQVVIGNEIKIKPIPFSTLNNNALTKGLPRCGAHFYGIRGDAVSSKQFKDLLTFLKVWDPSFDSSQLPRIPEPYSFLVKYEDRGKKKPEEWVEDCLV